MKLNKLKFFALTCFFVLACTNTTTPSSCATDKYTTVGSALLKPNENSISLTPAPNVLPMSVNGSQCNYNNSYINKPCVSVTVCEPGTSNCTTINDLLVDTGSYGLRVFKSALGTINLTQVTVSSKNLAECMEYGDGSKQWGPVQMADVKLNDEPAVSIPIQVIDSTFAGTGAASCGTSVELDQNPASTGFNGILGVGNKAQDCGSTCVSSTKMGYYFSCNGSSCNDTTVLLNNQVTHPVANLPVDNNGVILRLPNIGLGGQPSLEGYLVLGIGTQSNNTSSGVTAYPTDSSGNFHTTYGGRTLTGFTDSGTNLLVFPGGASNLPDCGCDYAGLYCPSSTQTLSATVTGIHGVPTIPVPFQLGNFISLVTPANRVYVELGATTFGSLGTVFDFGLPFFIGRNVYVGIENQPAPNLGTGPFVAF